jgi:hypothetical protein
VEVSVTRYFHFFYLAKGDYILMEEYKSNSHKSKQQIVGEKRVERVVKSPVKTKKKNDIQKFADVFITEDMANVKSYILMDILVPAVKKAISDVVVNGIDMFLYGETGRTKKKASETNTPYRSYYNTNNHSNSVKSRNGYSCNEYVINSRGEAEEVLCRMDEIIDTYGMVSVADFYDLVGVDGTYTDNKYGWTNIRNAYVNRVRDGYVIKLPRAISLD